MNTFFDMQPKRWMLVDDNEEFLMMITAMVENLTGATIECHNSPISALAAFMAEPEAYEVVITDHEMTGMTGIELCGRLQVLAPVQKVILTTGGGHFTREAAGKAGCSALLHKPFMFSALTAALAEAGVSQGTTFPA